MSHFSVQWSHELPGQPGVPQHGVLRIIGHGRAISGFVGTGSSGSVTLNDIQNVEPFFAQASAKDYALTSSSQAYSSLKDAEAASPASGQTWLSGKPKLVFQCKMEV
jgi:hypothetical protein